MAGAPVRVLVVDHDRASRAGVGLALAGHGFEVCAEADSAEAAMQAAHREQPELCLIEADAMRSKRRLKELRDELRHIRTAIEFLQEEQAAGGARQ